MSLRNLAHGLTSIINPDRIGDVYLNLGATTGYGGRRTPTFQKVAGVAFQVQAMSYGAMQHADSLNIQGVKRQVYFNGQLHGIERLAGRGGDILAFLGAFWLVADALEQWDSDGWCKVLVVQQTDPPDRVVTGVAMVSAQSGHVALVPEG